MPLFINIYNIKWKENIMERPRTKQVEGQELSALSFSCNSWFVGIVNFSLQTLIGMQDSLLGSYGWAILCGKWYGP